MSVYEEYTKLLNSISEWVEFIIENEGSEVSDYLSSLQEAISAASSATYDEDALVMTKMLKTIVDDAKGQAREGGWLYDVVEQEQRSYESAMEKYSESYKAHLAVSSPMEKLQELLAKG